LSPLCISRLGRVPFQIAAALGAEVTGVGCSFCNVVPGELDAP